MPIPLRFLDACCITEPMNSEPAVVNYDSEPLLEVELEGLQYRLDAGKQGTALCVSSRESGSWDWTFLGEAKWDAMSLRCKGLERATREQLAKALKETMADG